MPNASEAINLDLDEPNELLFKVRVEGTDPAPARVRMVCEADGMSYVFNGKTCEDDLVQFVVPTMNGKIKEGTYASHIEVLVENRCFVPVKFDVQFKKTVSVVAEVYKPALPPPPKVTVTAMPVVVKKAPVNEAPAVRPPQKRQQQAVGDITSKGENLSDDEIRRWAREMLSNK